MPRDESFDARECFYESGGHFRPLKLTCCQHKSPYSRRHERCSFSDTIADAIVFREHNPTAPPDFNQPMFVFSVRSKMVVVNLDDLAELAQGLRNDLSAEGTVDKKD